MLQQITSKLIQLNGCSGILQQQLESATNFNQLL
uniref:Uncharacterized protein n=1 Tax=Arundo donax TaxID=35708 RepID=A0A0A9BUZ5_ARUDO